MLETTKKMTKRNINPGPPEHRPDPPPGPPLPVFYRPIAPVVDDFSDVIDRIAYENKKSFEAWCEAFIDNVSRRLGIPKDVLLREMGLD